MCMSQPIGGHKGDNAIAINVRAIAEISGFGVSWMAKKDAFTDEHDVVLVPVHWGRVITDRSTALQDSSNSAELIIPGPQPATLPLLDQQHSSTVETARDEHEKTKSSAAQPAGLEESSEYLESADHSNDTQLQGLEENAENLERLPLSDQQHSSTVDTARDEHANNEHQCCNASRIGRKR